MDIVIPYINSRHQELKYCLRSIEKNFSHDNVYIIGDKIEWLTPGLAKNIIVDNEGRSREEKIFNKIAHACGIGGLSRQFVMVNDDHFFNHEIETIPYYFDGSLEEIYAYRRYRDGYTRSIGNTKEILSHLGLKTTHFDVHTPIIYDKDKIRQLENEVDWGVPFGYLIKSLYCNYFKVDGEYQPDCKLTTSGDLEGMERAIKGRTFFTTGDSAFPTAGALLEKLFPEKSKFEI